MGRPVGWIQPIHQASRTQANSSTDKATRRASARIMLPVLGLPSRPSRTMNTPADNSAPRMPTNATASRIFMRADYPPCPVKGFRK